MMVSRPERPHWHELDLLRGLAAALMVANHAAVHRGDVNAGLLTDAGGFVGSFAPVLFFLLTGLGNGIQSLGRPARGSSPFLGKALILIAADAFLWIRPGRMVGMDFLGFIGLSLILLRGLERLPRSGLVAALLAVGWVVLRFAIGPVVRPWLPPTAWGTGLGFTLGIQGIDGFSYPPAPWLAYPFLGYALGRLVASRATWVPTHRGRLVAGLLGLALVFGVLTVALVARGSILFRWGSQSWAFFVATLGLIAASLAVALRLAPRRAEPWVNVIALSGVRSFAVVPLHYVALAALIGLAGPIGSDWSYLTITSLALLLSFAGSRLVPAASGYVGALGPRGQRRAWMAGLTVAAVAFGYLALQEPSSATSLTLRTLSQFVLCVLLTLPLPQLVPPASSRPLLGPARPV